ncbi:integrase [Panacagrimonas perspica]|uniref:Integrase n=1 Tax=Panacagrimonas perspica TaxID=381431 RepID=A0A4R7PF18_9GAMM|nr:integrase arm-type DNA-binding domain-containing protein [Panacagrimonas perspica]TDU32825.1 integrase [Panacagrimonas perspica]THD00939.1 integrase [Panacagrimonas perspica]
MARRQTGKLQAVGLLKRSTGLHGDGGGLWLQVGPTGSKAWLFRFMLQGKAREMGLGPFPDVPLAEARQKAAEARALLRDKIDPIEARRALATARTASVLAAKTFKAAGDAFIEANKAGWKNAKHLQQWQNTLATYVYPKIGDTAVSEITTDDVLGIVSPIWTTKTETATRVRSRIEIVLDYAIVLKWRTAGNPARWRGGLERLLPRPTKVRKVKHHAALHYSELPAFMAALRVQNGIGPLALEFAILTAGRTGEVIGAIENEFDLESRVWRVPADRMKGGKPHHVPLSDRAVEILEGLSGTDRGFVFPGMKESKPLSNMALLATLKRMKRGDLTTHGFRSTFRDWCAEATSYPRDVAEMALAHSIPNKTEAAYRRGDLFEKRAALMRDWAAFCASGQTHRAPVPQVEAI